MHFLLEVLWSTPVRACRMSAKTGRTLAWSLQEAALDVKVANIWCSSTARRGTAMTGATVRL